MTIAALREKRAGLVAQAKAIMANTDATRSLSTEDSATFDRLMGEADSVKAQMDRLESLEAAERSLGESRGRRTTAQAPETDTVRSWLAAGVPGAAIPMDRNFNLTLGDVRAMATTSGAAGGFTTQDETTGALEQALKAFGGVRTGASVIRTATGNEWPIPLSDNTDEVAEILGQNVAATDGDLLFGQEVLKAFTYVTKIIKVPVEMIQDTSIDVAAYVGERLGEQIARGTNRHFTTGTRPTQPGGIVTGAVLGKTAAAVGAVTYDELVDMLHSIDPSYRAKFTWMFHDDTLRELRKLRDADGKLIWQESARVGEPDRILGKPYIINQDMAPMAAGAKSILGGDLSKYRVRDVKDVSVVRLDERFAEFRQVGFIGYSRHDGALVNAGTDPVKFLQNAAV